jgi:hypothetical protein
MSHAAWVEEETKAYYVEPWLENMKGKLCIQLMLELKFAVVAFMVCTGCKLSQGNA